MALRLKRSSQKDEFRRFPRLAIFRAKMAPRDERISCDGAG